MAILTKLTTDGETLARLVEAHAWPQQEASKSCVALSGCDLGAEIAAWQPWIARRRLTLDQPICGALAESAKIVRAQYDRIVPHSVRRASSEYADRFALCRAVVPGWALA